MKGQPGSSQLCPLTGQEVSGTNGNRKFQLNTNVFCCEGGQTLALVALGGCGASICGDHQNLTGQCPGHEAVAVGRDDLLSSLSCSVILSTASQEEIRRH